MPATRVSLPSGLPGGGVTNSYSLVAPKTWRGRRLRCTYLFVLVLVLVLDAISYSNPAHRSASSRESPRSTIGIAAV